MAAMKNMNKQTVIIIVLAVALVIGVGVVLAANNKKSTPAVDTTTGSGSTAAPAPTNPPQGNVNDASVPPTAPPASSTGAKAVTIKDYMFSEKDISVKAGTTVTWTNQDDVKHTVTADTPSADAPSSQLFGKGETYSFTFKKAGTYTYHCEPHPYMKATVTVTE
jgi:plastocyanin